LSPGPAIGAALDVEGAGTLTLTGGNTYTGGTLVLTGGTLSLAGDIGCLLIPFATTTTSTASTPSTSP
jgi:autotransporter-associated beta strand protein